MLIARKDPRRYDRVAARWLQRLLEEDPDVTIQEAALAASSLVALHADLCILATLASALARARAVPRAA